MEPIAEEIYILVKKKMAEQAAFTIDAYEELIDETIDYFREKGKLTDDDNEEFIKDQLMEMWESAEQELIDGGDKEDEDDYGYNDLSDDKESNKNIYGNGFVDPFAENDDGEDEDY